MSDNRGNKGGYGGGGAGGAGRGKGQGKGQGSGGGGGRYGGGHGGGYGGGRGAGGGGHQNLAFRPRGGGGRGGGAPPPEIIQGAPAPDPHVAQLEDAILASAKLAGKPNTGLPFPMRPGYGTKGKAVTLWANYVVLTDASKSGLVLYRYDVSVTPAVTGKKRAQVLRIFLEDTPELAGLGPDIVTDFKSTLISRTKLVFVNDNTGFESRIVYRLEGHDPIEDDGGSGLPATLREFVVKLQFTNALSVPDLVTHLSDTQPQTHTDINSVSAYRDALPTIQALNIFFNHHAMTSRNLVAVGSSKTFSLNAAGNYAVLGKGLMALRGVFASVRMATSRLLVNVNVSNGAFYQTGPLDRLIVARTGPGGVNAGNARRLETFLKRVRVQMNHLPPKTNRSGQVIPRIKTIFGLATTHDGQTGAVEHPPIVDRYGAGPEEVQFWMDAQPGGNAGPSTAKPAGKKSKRKGKAGPPQPSAGGRYITVYDFFKETYGIVIANPSLPVINVGNRENPTYLPAQVCDVIPGQPANAKLDPKQTQELIRFAVRQPQQSQRFITGEGLRMAGLTADTNPRLARFGLAAASGLITVPGRVLPAPKLMYGQNQTAFAKDGSWNLVPRDKPALKFSRGGSLKRWTCLVLELPDVYNERSEKRPQRFTLAGIKEILKRFRGILLESGMNVDDHVEPRLLSLAGDGLDDPQLPAKFKAAVETPAQLDFLLIVLPDAPIPLYNRIKRLGDVQHGIHTVCVVGSKLAKGQDQYLRNVALKCNLKMGGRNQGVDLGRSNLLSGNKTMVVGIDVTHPSPGSSSRAPSIAGMVANVDGGLLGQWPSVLRIQTEARQEMVAHLEDMLVSRLRLWQKHQKNQLPENILVYRDGVSEGQYPLVVEQELPLLKAACRQVYSPEDTSKGLPRFTLVVVGKRHHTRFYPTTAKDAVEKTGNTLPGTIVDRGVTEARSWDFFLQAHAALQGTVRPGHYVVLLDEIFRQKETAGAADRLEEITQSMCYVFGRATKAVSLCTPAYYADILCERARCYLSSVFDETPETSTVTGGAGGARGNAGSPSDSDVQIHAKLRDTMFYI